MIKMTPTIIDYVDDHFANDQLDLVRRATLAIEALYKLPQWEVYENHIAANHRYSPSDLHDLFLNQLINDLKYIVTEHYLTLNQYDLTYLTQIAECLITIMTEEAQEDALAILMGQLPPVEKWAYTAYLYTGIEDSYWLQGLDSVDPLLIEELIQYISQQSKKDDQFTDWTSNSNLIIKESLVNLKKVNGNQPTLGQLLLEKSAPIESLSWYLKEADSYFDRLSQLKLTEELFHRLVIDGLSLIYLSQSITPMHEEGQGVSSFDLMASHLFDSVDMIQQYKSQLIATHQTVSQYTALKGKL